MSEPNTSKLRSFKELWQSSSHQQVENDLAWLKKIRRAHFGKFLLHGLPTRRNEDWKYTDVQVLNELQFAMPIASKFELSMDQIQQLYFASSHHRLVFINGHFRQDLSKILELPRGTIITNLVTACKQFPDLVQVYLSQDSTSSFTYLNTAFMTDGVFIHVPEDQIIDLPIHVIYLHVADHHAVDDKPMMINLRNIIICEQNSGLNIFEDFQSLDDGIYFTNQLSHFQCDQYSNLQHVKLQNESKNAFHVSRREITQEQHSIVASHFYSTGSQLARDDHHPILKAVNAQNSAYGLYLAKNKQHIDHHLQTEHLAEKTISSTLFKGIVRDEAHAVFNGKIIVSKDASKTSASLQNQNLLLSPKAQIDTKPELEIYTDDVQCNHSATISQLDAELLFYLQARGIPHDLAYDILTLGFAKQILEFIPSSFIAEKINHVISAELRHEKNVSEVFKYE